MIRFPLRAYDALVEHALDSAPEECCGILTGSREGTTALVEAIHRTANVADAPRTTYDVDPVQQLAIMSEREERGETVLGFYHSHPMGPANPSPTDRERATWPNHTYVIVSLEGAHPFVGAWHLSADGFEPVVVAVESP